MGRNMGETWGEDDGDWGEWRASAKNRLGKDGNYDNYDNYDNYASYEKYWARIRGTYNGTGGEYSGERGGEYMFRTYLVRVAT